MKLGTETGSLINHAMSSNGKPVIGEGCTILAWSDRWAGTVIAIKQNIVMVQRDNAERVDSNGISEQQKYNYTRNKNGQVFCFRCDRHNRWLSVALNEKTGRYCKSGGYGVAFGVRKEYYDFSF